MAGNLTRDEAAARARLVAVESYAVDLDLDLGTGPERFGSRSLIRFRCAEPGAETFCELADATIHKITLNGTALDPGRYDPVRGRIALPGLAADNELDVVASCRYSRSGQGLHRYTDPADGQVYLHSQLAIADAQRVFACFDQPDLKATFDITVTAPADWVVVSNQPETLREALHEGRAEPAGPHGRSCRWRFPTTPPLPTYLAAVVAGPYHAAAGEYVAADGRRVPLRLLCRRSLAEFLDPVEILDITRQGLGFYERAFRMPLPFVKYDQAFVPELTLGAMENPGCVTVNERSIFRSPVTDAEREQRATIILHEMAHMWFGDLVTMRWWDDLWLNESFATYAATLALVEATRWTGGWATFAIRTKARAYRQDELSTTHPIAADIPDVRASEVNLDGITYYKGASVLKQLAATTGPEPFLAGLRAYFQRYAWGSTTLPDLLDALARHSGRHLSDWSAQWLQTTAPNTLAPEFEVDAGGRFTGFAVRQSAPPRHPTLRAHRLAIGLYDRGPAGLTRRARVELDVAGARTEVPELVGQPRPDLVLLNDDDLTYAKVRLDPGSWQAVLDGIGDFADPLPQAVCWTIAWDRTRDAELPAARYARLVLTGLPSVRSDAIVHTLLEQVRVAVQRYTDPAGRAACRNTVVDELAALARAAAPAGARQLAYVQALAGLAGAPEHLDLVAGLLDGSETLPGLVVGTDLRWALLRRLVVHGRAGAEQIDAEWRRDRTTGGARGAAACPAALGTVSGKAAAWQRAVSGELSNAVLKATLDGFVEPEAAGLLEPYVDRYFATLSAIVDRWPSELTQTFAEWGYPSAVVAGATLTRTDAYLTRSAPPAWLDRLVREGRDELARALRAHDTSGGGAPPAM